MSNMPRDIDVAAAITTNLPVINTSRFGSHQYQSGYGYPLDPKLYALVRVVTV